MNWRIKVGLEVGLGVRGFAHESCGRPDSYEPFQGRGQSRAQHGGKDCTQAERPLRDRERKSKQRKRIPAQPRSHGRRKPLQTR